jgi:hypothetical protein
MQKGNFPDPTALEERNIKQNFEEKNVALRTFLLLTTPLDFAIER